MDCLEKIKPYIPILYKLIIDLLLVGFDVVRQVILPNRRRKGNLLSSLFLLFVGLTDRFVTFGQALTRVPWTAPSWAAAPWVAATLTFGKKYIRQGMIIATWALFILSSFEWSGAGTPASSRNQSETTEPVQLCVSKPKALYAVLSNARHIAQPFLTGAIIDLPPLPSSRPAVRTWLRLCTLRI